MNIFLIGFMGSGKSTAGKHLAERLGHRFIDLDEYIEGKTNTTISSIFRSQGEPAFRNLESKALIDVCQMTDCVIATGGGTPCSSENMNLMNKAGTTVYLEVSVENLVNRLQDKKVHRPLIAGKTSEELKKYIRDKLSEREIYYRKAKYIVEGHLLDYDKLLREIRVIDDFSKNPVREPLFSPDFSCSGSGF